MKANELRIGNYLQDQNGNILLVIHISTESIQTTVLDRIKYPLPNGWQMEPIPLTPEILEKCGFGKDDESYFNEAGEKIHQSDSFKLRTKNSKLHIRYLYQTKEFLFWLTYNYEPERNSIHSSELFYYKDQLVFRKSEIYLHQLQNLIFALTGEELEVKL